MEDMVATGQLDASFLPKACNHANAAVVILAVVVV
jgi:hypothetical protein